MILAFSTRFPAGKGKISLQPTYFIDKILRGFIENDLIGMQDFCNYFDNYKSKFGKVYEEDALNTAKLHTIRKDTSNRWKAGNDIHFSINVRTKKQFQFAPVVKCVSTQTIKISYKEKDCEKQCCEPAIYIDNQPIDFKTLQSLALNDGFNSVVDFLNYFNTNYTGKIIHWTNLKY